MTRSLRPSNKQNALASASSATSSRKNEKRVAPKKTVVQVEPMPKRAPRTKTSWFMSISVTQSLMGATAFVVNSVSAVYLWTMASLVATFLPFYEMFMYFYAIFCHSIHQEHHFTVLGHYDYQADLALRHRLEMMEKELHDLRIKVSETTELNRASGVKRTVEVLVEKQLKERIPFELNRSLSSVVALNQPQLPAPASAPAPPSLPPPPPPPPVFAAPKSSIKLRAASLQKSLAPARPLSASGHQPLSLQTLLSARKGLRPALERVEEELESPSSPSSAFSSAPLKTVKSASGQQPVVTLRELTNIQLRARSIKKTTSAPSPKTKGPAQNPVLGNLRKTQIQRSPGGTPMRPLDSMMSPVVQFSKTSMISSALALKFKNVRGSPVPETDENHFESPYSSPSIAR